MRLTGGKGAIKRKQVMGIVLLLLFSANLRFLSTHGTDSGDLSKNIAIQVLAQLPVQPHYAGSRTDRADKAIREDHASAAGIPVDASAIGNEYAYFFTRADATKRALSGNYPSSLSSRAPPLVLLPSS